MNYVDVIIEKTDRYAEDLTSTGGFETQGPSEARMVSQTSGKGESGSGENENGNGEKEKQMERWMDQVKLFIRSIDIDRL